MRARLRAWAEIDLDALRENCDLLARIAHPAQLWCVVKADAYGHGAAQVWRTLANGGAAAFCVAMAREGSLLREAGCDLPIILLTEPTGSELEECIKYSLEPTVYTLELLEELSNLVHGKTLPVHVSLNTGMNRAGCAVNELAPIVERVRAYPQLTLKSVWSHFATASEPIKDPEAILAARIFETAINGLNLDKSVLRHMCNSAGTLSMPEFHLDAVRVGISTYGYSSTSSQDNVRALGLRPAMSIKGEVMYIHHVGAGERIGYGLNHTFAKNTKVAVVGIGYADGLARRWGDVGGTVVINAKSYDLVGGVTMDQVMIDVGEDDVAVSDVVTLMGTSLGEPTAHEIASALTTVPNEVICRTGARLRRIYVNRN